MCNPLIVMGASMAMSAYAAKKGQDAQNQAIEYNSKLMNQNAKIQELRAQDAEQRGAEEEKALRQNVAATKSRQRASISAAGVTVDQGSALDVLADTSALGEQDALTLRHNAAMEAWGHRVGASDIAGQRSLLGMQRRSPWETAGTSLLTQGSSYAGMYAMGKMK